MRPGAEQERDALERIEQQQDRAEGDQEGRREDPVDEARNCRP
jgi:hypothetical protein